ncbi:MAG: hypothetical protein WCD50_11325 [Onishia taeanensis]|uniref:hypothetical protein n=1 Tax=Onishia taeanensis TaxID=284577 RepID=UPI003C7CEB98
MRPRDCVASTKAALFSALFPARSQALSPALALALVLGWGLSDASFNVMFSDRHDPVPAQAMAVEPAVAVNGTANTAPSLKPWGAWEGKGAPPHRTWPKHSEREATSLEGAGCSGECLETLRQRLLDHHRQAAPVWVF